MKLPNQKLFFCALTAMLLPTLSPTPAIAAIGKSPWQVADLRSFFHGDPPPPPKAPPPKQLAVVSTLPGVGADSQIENFLRAFAEAVKARDGKALLPRLSDKYSIDDMPAERKAGDLFLQAIEQIAGPSEIVITSIESNGTYRTAKVEFRFAADKVKPKMLRFDAGGKLLWSDLFKLQVQRGGV